jgi:NADPH:quinone reductase-like Zn-dependent oxidoreductase
MKVCGYVEETGDDVDLKIGTKVIALPPIGGFSEYVSVDKNLVIPVSEKVECNGWGKLAYKLWYLLLRT